MESFSQPNITVEEGSSMQVGEIFFTDEPLNFEDINASEMSSSNKDSNEIQEATDYIETARSCSSSGNEEQVTYLQMIWNGSDSTFENCFLAIRGTLLTDTNESTSQNASDYPTTVYEVVSSDEESVVLLGTYSIEYREASNVDYTLNDQPSCSKAVPREEIEPRRNPTRKARNNKYVRKSNDENIYEEDFCMLDSSEDESSPDESAAKSSTAVEEEEAQNLSAKDMKKWPVNGLHERPEYNTATAKIEKFDYTIREIQGTVKKTKSDDSKKAQPPKKRPAKKYTPKKRGTKCNIRKAEPPKVNLDSLKDLINENYSVLLGFVRNVRQSSNSGTHMCHSLVIGSENDENSSAACNSTQQHENCLKNYNTLMSSQSRLYALVNKISYQDALKALLDKSEDTNNI